MNDIDMFEKANQQIDDIMDGLSIDELDVIEIDTDALDKESKEAAIEMIDNLSKLYCNEEFMKNNPAFKKRVDAELESMRILIKMRKSDEIAHDLLIKAIAGNSGNASLYRSLSEIQKTIISITTKINEIITGLNQLMKGYQLELNFKEETESQSEDNEDKNPQNTFKGSKEFIQNMLEQEN